MPYVKKVCRYKNVEEVERVHAGRYGKGGKREDRRLPTPEEMEKINERNVITKLRRKIHANFDPGDLWLTLTYRQGCCPTPEEAQKKIRNYMERLRRAYRKQGAECQWVLVTEYLNKRIHHHLVLNDLPDGTGAKLAASKWTDGGAHCKFLYEDGQYENLAAYIVKETQKHFRDPGYQAKSRYSCSRNLIDPPVKRRIMKRDDWPEEPRVPKGFYLDRDSLRNGMNRLGFKYQYYRLIRIDRKERKRHGNRKKRSKNQSKRDAGDKKAGPS